MKDSQQMNERLEEYGKYIKVNNERFSTFVRAGATVDLSISR